MALVFLMRVSLPDRPGSLGAVASAMGSVGGDINAVEIVEKGDGVVVDDFIVDLPPGQLPETIITACHHLEGVRVEWISRYPEGGGLQSDLEALERMTADPANAAETLVALSPVVFRSHWSVLLQVAGDEVSTLVSDRPVRRDAPGRARVRVAAGLGRVHRRGGAADPGPGDRDRPTRRTGVPRFRDRPAAPSGRAHQIGSLPR
jgi:hypothetical protein